MKFITDFHIHSHFSMATSKKLTPEYLSLWGQIKGIGVIGTGDCIHPGWSNELKDKLKPLDNGLFALKSEEFRDPDLPVLLGNPPKPEFMLTTEISSIYKKNGRVRKVHNLCVFPDFTALEYLQKKLAKIGNISSDGRPILGLDSKNLLELVLESADNSFLIPAHIWTPWFSVLGSKSGFDSLEECYEDLTPHIFAVETGLSSDPPMNRVCSFLDNVRLVSNSDAHSPEKLGREANIFDTELSYNGIYNSLKKDEGFLGTIEFFPEEGKYFYDGHRKCNTMLTPVDSIKKLNICPVCEKPLTLGVMYRVAQLADRKNPSDFKSKQDFKSITALPDIISEITQKNTNTKTVKNEYYKLIENIGSEFHILLDADLNQIKEIGGDVLCEAIRRLRNQETIISPGFDGEFGTINLFKADEIKNMQNNLIFPETPSTKKINKAHIDFDVDEFQRLKHDFDNNQEAFRKNFMELNALQKKAIKHMNGPAVITGGPGTGKTKIITERMIALIEKNKIQPKSILMLTFSDAKTESIKKTVSQKITKTLPQIESFEKFGLNLLKKHSSLLGRAENFIIIEDEDKAAIIESLIPGITNIEKDEIIDQIAGYKEGFYSYDEIDPIFNKYENTLLELNAIDKEDLIFLPIQIFLSNPTVLKKYSNKLYWILIDDYQNINKNQQRLVELLSETEDLNIFITADINQATLDTSSSNHYFLNRFEQKYTNHAKIHLNKSYRLCPFAIKTAKEIFTQDMESALKNKKDSIDLFECKNEKDEAKFICNKITDITALADTSDKNFFSQIAVFMRTESTFTALKEQFLKNEIPFSLITEEPKYRKTPLWEPLNHFRKVFYGKILDTTDHNLPINTEIKELIKQKKNITFLLRRLSLYYSLNAKDTEYLHNLSNSFKNNYNDFANHIALHQGIDQLNSNTNTVKLMTLDTIKDTEFKNVFLAGCNDGFIPFEMFGKKTESEIQREERLFYVAITRFYEKLFITYSQNKNFNGKIIYPPYSRFLNKLPLKIKTEKTPLPTLDKKNKQLTLFEL